MKNDEIKVNIIEMLIKGGWIMIPIIILFFIAIGVFIERILVLRKVFKNDKIFIERIRDYIYEGDIKLAKKLCKRENTSYSQIIEKGIQYLGSPINDILLIMKNIGSIEVSKLEKGVAWLATSAAIAPMLGFLGTVLGMVQAFFNIANAGNAVDIMLLSSSIYQALVTTVAGLFVGIPVLFAYNYLVARIDALSIEVEAYIVDFIDLLNEKLLLNRYELNVKQKKTKSEC